MKRHVLCVVCGENEFSEGMCRKCYSQRKHLPALDPLTVCFCELCSDFYQRTERYRSLEPILAKKFHDRGVKMLGCEVTLRGKKALVSATVRGRAGAIHKTENMAIVLSVQKKLCDTCQKIRGGYYEALIQVRGEKKDALLKRLHHRIPSRYVVSVVSKKEGTDIKVSSKRIAQKAVNQLGCSITKSYKLITRKEGKDVYRDSYAVR